MNTSVELELCFCMQVAKEEITLANVLWGFSVIGIYLSRAQRYGIKATSTDDYFRPKDFIFFFSLCSIWHIRFSLPWLYDWLWCHIMVPISQINTFSFKTTKELKSLHRQTSPRQGEENLKDK